MGGETCVRREGSHAEVNSHCGRDTEVVVRVIYEGSVKTAPAALGELLSR